MNFTAFYLFFLLAIVSSTLNAKVRVDNVADYHFGMVRPGQFPVKESTLWVAAKHYTVVIYGNSDTHLSFNLAYGVHKVPYTISWKDNTGNFASLLPNTISPVFSGAESGLSMPATLVMQIKGDFPKPGHYSDRLTLIITPV